jgi:hypothetical protein
LISLHLQCPQRAYVGDPVTCSATGVFNDNLSVAEDLSAGPWNVGPTFTSQQPGPVTVQITRFNMTGTETVMFENKPPPQAPGPYNPFNDPNFMPPQPKTPPRVGQGPADPLPPGLLPPATTGGAQTGSAQTGQPIPGNYTGGAAGEPPPGSSSGTGQPKAAIRTAVRR